MALTDRIARLEAAKRRAEQQCQRCHGMHIPDWLTLMQAADNGATVCGCCKRCRWVSELPASGSSEEGAHPWV